LAAGRNTALTREGVPSRASEGLEGLRRSPRTAKADQGPRRRSFKESRELEALDRELPELEQRKAALESALSTAGSDDLTRLSEELAAVHQQLEQTEERWLELSELAP
jgi:ATP-binding cassette subfamily F protein uup